MRYAVRVKQKLNVVHVLMQIVRDKLLASYSRPICKANVIKILACGNVSVIILQTFQVQSTILRWKSTFAVWCFQDCVVKLSFFKKMYN